MCKILSPHSRETEKMAGQKAKIAIIDQTIMMKRSVNSLLSNSDPSDVHVHVIIVTWLIHVLHFDELS